MPINIECDFKIAKYFYTFPEVYTCVIRSIILPDGPIISVTGTHLSGKGHSDVVGIYGGFGPLQTFPKGLENIFENLKAIYTTSSSQIKEIHREDLKGLPNLVELLLDNNRIEVVEEGLFDYTPNLAAISFYYNKVYHVNFNVFDNLTKLRYLWMNGCPCYSGSSHDRLNTLSLIKNVQSSCQNKEIVKYEAKLKDLRSKSTNPNQVKEFKKLLADYEADFQSISDSKLFYLKNEYLNLKNFVPNEVASTTESQITSNPECVEKFSKEEFSELGKKINDITETLGSLNEKIDDLWNIMKNMMDQTCSSNFTSVFKERIEFYEENLKEFQINVLKKFESIENEYKLTHYKMSKTLDLKLQNIEDRLFDLKKESENN